MTFQTGFSNTPPISFWSGKSIVPAPNLDYWPNQCFRFVSHIRKFHHHQYALGLYIIYLSLFFHHLHMMSLMTVL